jgi:IS30 family transposase
MHRQLTYDQRQCIQQLSRKGESQAAIARQIGVHRSTVKRELERNSQEGEYNAHMAHVFALGRKKAVGYDQTPPIRMAGQKSTAPKRSRHKMLKLRRSKWRYRYYFRPLKYRKRRREFLRHRYGRFYLRHRRYRYYMLWYYRFVRERNYAREQRRRKLLQKMWGRKVYTAALISKNKSTSKRLSPSIQTKVYTDALISKNKSTSKRLSPSIQSKASNQHKTDSHEISVLTLHYVFQFSAIYLISRKNAERSNKLYTKGISNKKDNWLLASAQCDQPRENHFITGRCWCFSPTTFLHHGYTFFLTPLFAQFYIPLRVQNASDFLHADLLVKKTNKGGTRTRALNLPSPSLSYNYSPKITFF